MAQIDIQITFDAETIVAQYGRNTDPASPVAVSADLVYMVVAQDDALSGDGGGEVTVKAAIEDTLRWREATPGPDYSAMLYAFLPTQGGSLFSTPQPFTTTVTVPLPDPGDPTQPRTQTIQDYYWSSNVLGTGQETYHFWFMVVSRQGEVLGYYWWDPLISITS